MIRRWCAAARSPSSGRWRCCAASPPRTTTSASATSRPAPALSVSTAHRLLQALRADGLVAQDPRTERYHLGAGLVALGGGPRRGCRFDHLAAAPRGSSPRTTGESVSLGTRVGDEVLIVLHVDSPQPLRFDQPPGTFVPVHASAIGKALLAFAPDPAAEVAELPTLGGVHAATLTTRDALLADLEAPAGAAGR